MTYTFNISKNNNNNTFSTSSNRNDSKNIDAIILSNLKSNIPYLFDEDDDNDIITFTPKKTKKDIITFIPKKKNTIDINISTGKTKKNGITFGEFCKAFNYLMSNEKDTYDFKLDDGTPIKIFSDEIQIGYELLPLTTGTKRIYNLLSDKRKKDVIDIYINIKK